jgi:nucleotide-binding universal stress UspA family protein
MARILVPVDGSDGALRALAFAVKRAKEKAGTSIHLLTVHPPLDTHGRNAVYPGDKRMHELVGMHDAHILRGAEKRLRRARIRYSTEAIEGDPAEIIARRAKALKCDSIVMGSRGLGRIASLVIGSVAFKVIHLTPLPVTLVK